ncbi:deoxyribodipyrimidine photo-lyase [Shouchella sp. JSM 1781072]|uniref:cryptochrome/photolyase family protein n=1 Tax=Shouchella sp. JSM 1781072 TaxID=3344581 RepID=UPI0035C24FA4
MAVHIVWFRRDLRLSDHQALAKAIENADQAGDTILGVFHIHPALTDSFTVRHDYFYETLKAFVDHTNRIKFQVVFLYGELEESFDQLLSSIDNVKGIYFNKDETGFGKTRDDAFESWAEQASIQTYSFIDHHLHGAYELLKGDGEHYKVFTPYYKKWRQLGKPEACSIDEDVLTKRSATQSSVHEAGDEAYKRIMQQKTGKWKDEAGEKAAHDYLATFLDDRIEAYEKDRDFPEYDGTSQLSKFLRTGALSIRTVFHAVQEKRDQMHNDAGAETFIQELAWRDFYNMIYAHYPSSHDKEIKEQYQGIEWRTDEEQLEAWKEGKTGYPLVDAAMRQLNTTGWMHNRLRMVVASFLTKHLLIDWRLGEHYFAERLIDYDPASNIGGWQWAASTGTDAVPYFRVFNPYRQAERFDPHGRFIRSYVEELRDVPTASIHKPYEMDKDKQKEYGSDGYPAPIVDHQRARQRALEAFGGS